MFMITICSNNVLKLLNNYSKDTELVSDRAGNLNLGLADSDAYIFFQSAFQSHDNYWK